MSGELISVNIGASREVEHNGRTVRTGIFKTPTVETQQVAGVHIGADVQADTDAHGGPDKAVYAYAGEDYDWWEAELGRSLDAAFFGENLTTRGIDISGASVGDRWSVGSTVFEVSEPRVPCFKLGIRSGISRFQQQFSRADRPGAYLRIVEEGELTVGDAVAVTPVVGTTATMVEIAVMYHRDHEAAARLIEVTGLSDAWRRWARDASGAV